jgi:hypothetical protein
MKINSKIPGGLAIGTLGITIVGMPMTECIMSI